MTVELVTIDQNGFPVLDPPSPKEPSNLWDCIDPNAFLCYCVQSGALPLDGAVRLTLDNFGWLNEDGFPDYEKMNREFARNA